MTAMLAEEAVNVGLVDTGGLRSCGNVRGRAGEQSNQISPLPVIHPRLAKRSQIRRVAGLWEFRLRTPHFECARKGGNARRARDGSTIRRCGRRNRVCSFRSQRGDALDHVAKLANVASPTPLGEVRERRFVERCTGRSAKVRCEERDVFATLTKRWNGHGENGDAEIEVFTKLARRNHGSQIAMGCRNEADVDAAVNRIAQAANGPLLEDTKELRLQIERQLSDFVEKYGARVGRLDGAHSLFVGSRERAPCMAEELRFQKGRRKTSAIDDDERAIGATRHGVDRACNNFLAGPGLALNENGCVRRGHFLEALSEALHRWASPNEAMRCPKRSRRLEWGGIETSRVHDRKVRAFAQSRNE